MSNAAMIKALAEETAKSLAADPEQARSGGCTKVRMRNGLTCRIEDGPWKLTADLPLKSGGQNEGPNPGVFIRAALGSCLTMDIVTWAARLDVPLTAVEIEVESTLDARGMYGVDDSVPPGYQGLRIRVKVESPASDEEVQRVVETAEVHNPRLYDLTHAIPVERDLVIAHPPRADSAKTYEMQIGA